MLKYARRKINDRVKNKYIDPLDVLTEKMRAYSMEGKSALLFLTTTLKDFAKNNIIDKEMFANIRAMSQLMLKVDEMAIDCAHKLAPYRAPKLESIEVKNNITHQFVLKAPQRVQSVEEWAKITGAEAAKLEDLKDKETTFIPPAPSIHDFEDDEIETQKKLLN